MPLGNDDETVRTALTDQYAIGVTEWGAHSDIGLVRKRNEDAWGEKGSSAFVVADGMGGTSGGAIASAHAVAGFLAANPLDGWLTAMQSLNASVRQTCAQDGHSSAGTTLVGLLIDHNRCVTINIGDSRIYRLRDGDLELLTVDHNLGNLRREEGRSPEADDGRGRPAALTSYLGSRDDEQRVDIRTISVREGDRILLCSDGVHGQLSTERIAALIQTTSTCAQATELLTAESAQAGGRDNATALLVELSVEAL